MIATIDLTAILDETDRLNELILHSQEARQYRLCKLRMDQDEEAQACVQQFIAKKELFEEVERFGKYHPDYARVKQEMRVIKRSLDMNEHVARFKKAEKELENIMADISKTIAHAVSETIKVPTGNAFFDEAAVNGGCGSGGGGCGDGGCSTCGNN